MQVSIIKNNVKAIKASIESTEALGSLIQQEVWAAATFKTNRRAKVNFKQTELLVLDIDSGCSLTEAISLFKSYKHIIGTTRSHQLDKNGLITDRFRVVLFLNEPITCNKQYAALYKRLLLQYPFIDPSCSDSSRQWYPCTSVYSINSNGSLIEIGNTGVIGEGGSTILDSVQISSYSSKNTACIYKYLVKNKASIFLKTKIPLKRIASFLGNRVTGLTKGRERMNQEALAKVLKVNRKTIGLLLKKLTNAGLIRLKHPPITGVDSAVYEAGPELLKLLKAQPGPLKGQPKTVPNRPWTNNHSNRQMLADIRACKAVGLSQFQALEVLKKNQAHRPQEKQRSNQELIQAIEAWYNK